MSTLLTEEPIVVVNPLSLDRPVEKTPKESKPARKPPKPRNRRWILFVVLAAALGGGGYAYTHFAPAKKTSAGSDATAEEAQQPAGKATLGFASQETASKNPQGRPTATVTTVPVDVVQRSGMLRLTGSLIADERSSVASNTSGIAAEVLVDRGSIVHKNDVLVQIDPTDAKNKLAEGTAMLEELKARLGLEGDLSAFNPENQPEVRLAKASADLASANLKRAKDLFARKVVSAESYDQTQTEYELATQRYRQALMQIKQAYRACETAQTKLAILEKAVADTTIRAPFDGWVAEKLVSVGEQICSGMQATKVITLVRIDPLRLALTVSQQDVSCIEPGQTVRFHIDSFPDRTFTGQVRFIAPVVANDTRSMIVEALVKNPNAELRPGMFATAELELPGEAPQIFVPLGAVQKTNDVARVFVVRDGVAHDQVVALGDAVEGRVQVTSGLTDKDVVVTNPELVRDGDVVRR